MNNGQNVTAEEFNLTEHCRRFVENVSQGRLISDRDVELCLPSQYTYVQQIIIGSVLTLLTVLTAGGNLLIMLAVLLVRRLRSPSNLLILNLALSDFLIGFSVLPYAIVYQLKGYWPFNQTVCSIYIVSDVLLCTSSILGLCAISVDRYLAITRPLTYITKRTTKRMLIMIAFCWVLAATISIPPVFQFEKPKIVFRCDYSEDLTYQIYATFSAFYIPLFVMIILYGRIFCIVRRLTSNELRQSVNLSTGSTSQRNSSLRFSWATSHHAHGRSFTDSPQHNENPCSTRNMVKAKIEPGELNHEDRVPKLGNSDEPENRELTVNRSGVNKENHCNPSCKTNSVTSHTSTFLPRRRLRDKSSSHFDHKRISSVSMEHMKAVTTLGVIMGSFTLCWLPFFICQLLTPIFNIFGLEIIPIQLFQVFLWLGYMNSLLNPIIYAKFNQEFRLPFIYILKCKCRNINQRIRRASFATSFEPKRQSRRPAMIAAEHNGQRHSHRIQTVTPT